MIKRSVLLATLALVACESSGDDRERFRATLTGAAEVPPKTTTASGTTSFFIEGDELHYTLDVQGITGAIAAHIHSGAAGVNGPPVVFLFQSAAPGVNVQAGALAAGAVDATDMIPSAGVSYDSMLSLMRSGNAYVNVHTVANPPGEIRGQIAIDD